MATKYTRELLEMTAARSKSVAEMMRHLGLRPAGGTHWHLSKKLKMFGVDTSHFLGQAWQTGIPSINRLQASEILVYNRLRGRRDLAYRLRRALQEIGRSYLCEACGLASEWNGKELRLQVDHKDGNGLNNRPENLRFICPNCHSQTENYGSYAYAKNDRYCFTKNCSTTISSQSKSGLCRRCHNQTVDKSRSKIEWDKTTLRDLIWSKPIRDVAKDLGVSDTAVHKACKRLGVKKPPKGYWLRKRP